ncbi:type II toxin-antitoxin system Phd/YefM family antitoxin [Denitrobacterium detoxificans]|jgi:prevent-host-death family protein|uniref:type II toxin-antitoxin system Phd/YefM family antitoxin n=1 Tax=Denitrobacterium detoxificans TaxID=79604 RepID=UPI0026F05264|nr:type II toxin-antitoxin system Phd/YefM family antitoxin [Denitrobacterium detoxificans]MBE6466819.1 type II toxin-antitoxin system Phd/YefM family antitoxin [Denitrobacterium detoxificans]
MTALTASVAEARNNFSRIAEQVNQTGREVVVFRHSKPWVKISPVGAVDSEAEYVDVMDAVIERGLADYEAGKYVVGVDAARAELQRRVSERG